MTLTGVIVKINSVKKDFASIKVMEDNTYKIYNVAGRIYEPKVDMRIIAEGEAYIHPVFGQQFKVDTCRLEIPKTAEAVIDYLSSGLITGVGETLARRIVDHFGPNVVEEIIEKTPARLAEVKGISPAKAQTIAKCHSANFVYQELAAMKLSPSQIHKLYDQYGPNAVTILKTNPYLPVYEIDGFGFKTVDAIALKNGVAPDSSRRIAAAITFSLTQIGEDGHCWCHVDNLAELIDKLLPDVSDEKIADQIIEELKKGTIIQEDERVYARSLYWAEVSTAKGLVSMVQSTSKLLAQNKLPVSDKQIESAIWEMELAEGFELEKMQKQAVACALKNRICVITGGPGTGKSTITSAIVKGWMKQYPRGEDPDEHIVLCAPTGRAARRASELSGVTGETIQRILARHAYEEDEDTKLFILDEASMLDIRIASRLIELVKDKHFLVLIGDVDQLPPIGPGHFFRDCVQSAFIPTVQLTLSHRQKGKIAVNANRINMGEGFHALNLDDPSFKFVYANKQQVQAEVIRQYMGLLQRGYTLQDICCVVPIRKPGRSQTSADDLNWLIREMVNPPPEDVPEDFKNEDLRPGDRVMNTENDYDRQVFNGDCGVVYSVNKTLGITTVLMDDGRYVDYNKHVASFLILAYVTTVHKAQGSEYKAVVVAQNMEHAYMLQRNLLYTALTRAKNELILVGEPRAIDIAVQKIPALERNTCLKERVKTLIVKAQF